MSRPYPELNGLRVRLPNTDPIYLIDEGLRRWIPNPETYDNLFRDWQGVREDFNVNDISYGTNITHGAVLARGSGTDPVYLVNNGVKRWITSPAAMDRYHFSWTRVYDVPRILLQYIPTGSNINA